jgi:hypothetical protein
MSLVRRLQDLKHSAAGLYGLQRLGGLDRSPGQRPLACNFSTSRQPGELGAFSPGGLQGSSVRFHRLHDFDCRVSLGPLHCVLQVAIEDQQPSLARTMRSTSHSNRNQRPKYLQLNNLARCLRERLHVFLTVPESFTRRNPALREWLARALNVAPLRWQLETLRAVGRTGCARSPRCFRRCCPRF